MTSTFGLLRERTFRRIFTARAVSLLGSSVAPVALAFAVLGHPGGSATRLGVVMAGRSVAQVGFLLVGGALADRFSRRRLMVGSDLLAFVAQAGVAALVISGTTPLALLTALSALNGAAAAVFWPASRAVIPQIVEGPSLHPANALMRLSENSASLAGVAVAGVLIVAAGAGWALAIDAVTFAISAVLVLFSPTPQAEPDRGPIAVLTDLREGWREFRSRQWLWVVVAQFSLVNLCFSPCVTVLGPLVAMRHLGGAVAWSVILTGQGVGLIAGSLVVMRLRPAYPLLVATIGTFGFLPPLFLLAAAAPVWLLAVSMLGNGLAADVFEVLWMTALQEHIPDHLLSRVNSFDALGSFALGPIGLLLVGPVSGALGIMPTLIAAGLVMTAGNVSALATRSVRALPARPPAVAVPAGGPVLPSDGTGPPTGPGDPAGR